jgi:hypothetical protein
VIRVILAFKQVETKALPRSVSIAFVWKRGGARNLEMNRSLKKPTDEMLDRADFSIGG